VTLDRSRTPPPWLRVYTGNASATGLQHTGGGADNRTIELGPVSRAALRGLRSARHYSRSVGALQRAPRRRRGTYSPAGLRLIYIPMIDVPKMCYTYTRLVL